MNSLENQEYKDDIEAEFDQTSFFDQSSTSGKPYSPLQKTAKALSEEELKKIAQQKKWVMLGGGFFAFFVVILGIVFMMMRQTPIEEQVVEPTPPALREKDDFEQKIINAEILLKEADPALTAEQFPPVDLELRLDQPER